MTKMTKLRSSLPETITTIIPRCHRKQPASQDSDISTSSAPARRPPACRSPLTPPPPPQHRSQTRYKGPFSSSAGTTRPQASYINPNAAMKSSSAINAKSPLAEWSNTRDSGRHEVAPTTLRDGFDSRVKHMNAWKHT